MSGWRHTTSPGRKRRTRKKAPAGEPRVAILKVIGEMLGEVQPPSEGDLMAETRRRAGILAAGLGIFLSVLMLRATLLMVLPNTQLEALGRGQFQTAIEMKGKRGAIYDRNGRELAVTVDLPTLYANPARMPESELSKRLADIAKVTGHSENWVREQFDRKTAENKPLQRIKLGSSLEPVTARALIAGLAHDVMWLEDEPIRMYPSKELASPLIGYTDASGAGAAGIERLLNQELAGDTWRVMLSHDRKGRSVQPGRDEQRLAREGRSIRMTVDAVLQHEMEAALWRVMQASAPDYAMAVMMDVHTGAILAMASVPAGNPNDGASREHQALFQNHTAMDQVEPGSVMKPYVIAAALEEGLIRPGTMVDCELGAWSIGGRTIKDDHPKGVISVSDVIKFSSNIGTAKVGFMLGAEKMLNYLKDFGFSRSTGLNLPGEVRGILRSPATIRPLELATTAFGQGVTASPIQLVAAVSALANGGVRMMPYMVDAILDQHGDVETWNEPRIDRSIVSEETARQVTLMMESVTEEGGTGTHARVAGYQVAGKTGTAQKVENGVYSPTKRLSSFVGFLPADHPVVAIAVVVDSPTIGSKYGGLVAAPAFSDLGAFTMRYLGVPPDPSIGLTPSPKGEEDPVKAAQLAEQAAKAEARAKAKAEADAQAQAEAWAKAEAPLEIAPDEDGKWILPDFTGRSMRAAVSALQPTGVALKLQGSGRVAEQRPAPGSKVAAGETVTLSFN